MFASLPLIIVLTLPSRAECPPTHYVNGARDGVYECRTKYPFKDDCTRGGCKERVDPNESAFKSRIYCTNGMETVQDGRSVWCARRKKSWTEGN